MEAGTKIKVQMTVEVTVSSAWGSDWKVGDIVKEARRVGIDSLRSVLIEGKKSQDVSFGIVGEPKLLAVLTPANRSAPSPLRNIGGMTMNVWDQILFDEAQRLVVQVNMVCPAGYRASLDQIQRGNPEELATGIPSEVTPARREKRPTESTAQTGCTAGTRRAPQPCCGHPEDCWRPTYCRLTLPK